MTFDEALKYLLSLGHETLAIKLGLENTERLLEALGGPHEAFPSVQIAGTNGKGSTAVMLDAICRAANLNTGLYTSPHLVSITERIRTRGQQLSQEDFARAATLVRATAENLLTKGELAALPTFFEHVTAIALCAFKEARVELAILETGLGGRLDATTAARANIVAITPIALDHQEYLGDTLSQIASEKAAIIRAGVTAVIAPQTQEAREVILKRCKDCNVTPRFARDDIRVTGSTEDGRLRISFRTEHDSYQDVTLGLRGRHQMINASVAVALAEELREQGCRLTREAILEGLETAEHAGRLEMRAGRPPVLFDGAHNAAGARALRDYLDEFVHVPVALIFGAMRDKDLDEITAALFPAAHKIILTQPTNPRAATVETVASYRPPDFDSERILLAPTPAEALVAAQNLTPPDGLICITGSLYLIGEMQSLMEAQE
ncbi:MAG: folylpolyglutamate synthase/dihydrofolate synthase family protein [Pyrinomonadaceae bacterium]